jgi:hypothetical protein
LYTGNKLDREEIGRVLAMEEGMKSAVDETAREFDALILEKVWMMGKPFRSYGKLCRNHMRLYELVDFLQNTDEDFVVSLRVQFTYMSDLNDKPPAGRIEFVKKLVEFSIGLEGITLDGTDEYKENVAMKWMLICDDRKYLNDFSRLLDGRNFEKNPNAIIFLIDYLVEGYQMIEKIPRGDRVA